jgi:glycosyltransferase involved in cell wall biosynthesis
VSTLRILALEPYYGGSHRAFLDDWIVRSRHRWTLLTLPAHKWKWRMRHGAVTFARDLWQRVASGGEWDLLFCSDMLSLAELRGLAPPAVRGLPGVVYFHENQLTYPAPAAGERDLHFAFTNLTTALAADAVWFNSAFHRDELLGALPRLLARMPDFPPYEAIEAIRARSRVEHPGVAEMPSRTARRPGPMRILWAARWEHDKNPAAFFAAVDELAARGVAFRISVVGQRFERQPPCFAAARQRQAERIDRWGYQAARDQYEAALLEADVLVSTADHEFFGLGVVEALAAGAYPVLPNRLSYPEIVGGAGELADELLYDGTIRALSDRLAVLAERLARGDLWWGRPELGRRLAARFGWSVRAPELDEALDETARSAGRLA